MTTSYDDIINLPHPEPDPGRHPRMSLMARAAQFAPFAALGDIEADFAAALQSPSTDPTSSEPDFYPDPDLGME